MEYRSDRNMILFEHGQFKVTVAEKSGDDTVHVQFVGNCSHPDFLHNADRIITVCKNLDAQNIFLDIEHLININSRFVGLLIVLAGSSRYYIGLKKPSEFLKDLLNMAGILRLFHIFENFKDFTAECGNPDPDE